MVAYSNSVAIIDLILSIALILLTSYTLNVAQLVVRRRVKVILQIQLEVVCLQSMMRLGVLKM